MNHWLFKTDPDTYSWKDLIAVKREVWDGVSNNLALKHLRSVKKSDLIFIYHTGDEKAVIGIAEAVSEPYSSKKDPKLVVVDLVPLEALFHPVSLSRIKANKKLSSWELVRLPRLSVMPVSEIQWNEVMALSKSKEAALVAS